MEQSLPLNVWKPNDMWLYFFTASVLVGRLPHGFFHAGPHAGSQKYYVNNEIRMLERFG